METTTVCLLEGQLLGPPHHAKMHSKKGEEDSAQDCPSPEELTSPTFSLEELSLPRYKDEEISERTRRAQARASVEYGDLELGNVPLLPTGHPDQHRGLDDSDSDSDFFDYEEQSEQLVRHDPSLSCTFDGFCAWLRGPVPPHVYRIKPWLPRWQLATARLVERWAPRRGVKIALLVAGMIFWIAVFFASLQASVAAEIPGYGQPVKLSCHDRLWTNATDCGLNGESCLPFDDLSFAFRCPAGCSAATLLEPYTVGNRSYNYRHLVIGGKPFRMDGHKSGLYRGDSSICASALHAGLISDTNGGCGILHRRGQRDNFENYTNNGIESIAFKPSFPISFILTREASSSESSQAKLASCSDIRWWLFAFTVVVTTIFSMTITSAPVFYSITYFIVWFQVAMASDPPNSESFYSLLQIGLGRFLPGAFVGFALYYFCVRRTLDNLEAHAEKTILWLGGCWVGALNSDTFDRMPISRLTPHDLQQQPGAITALIICIGVLIVAFLIQAHSLRREGRLLSALRLYGVMLLVIIVLILVPNMTLRIHHYILALLLIPGTALQTRPSLLFQGLMLGLFINGIARWGFDSILQTPASLLEGGRLGTTPPPVHPPQIENRSHLVFSFPDIPVHVDGISVIVNDVLRYQGLKGKDGGSVPDFAWSRQHRNQPEYFQLGYVHVNALGGVWYEDFSVPSTWAVDGDFYYPV